MSLFEAEKALGEGREWQGELNACEQEMIAFRHAQSSNDAERARVHLTRALEISRASESRDHLLEARIRMEWGVLRASLGEGEQAGIDLKWAMDRLEALEEGHPWHGLAMLNLARWHTTRGEGGMALAIHSQISRHGPHPVETISLSRRRAAELFLERGHGATALRHLWVAHHGFRDTGLEEEALEAALHWLDLGLSEVSEEALTMDEAIDSAAPRSLGESMPPMRVHPQDVRTILRWLEGRTENQDALLVLEDAVQALQS